MGRGTLLYPYRKENDQRSTGVIVEFKRPPEVLFKEYKYYNLIYGYSYSAQGSFRFNAKGQGTNFIMPVDMVIIGIV